MRNSADGHLHTKETGDMTTGKGAGIGALIGGVVGILGGPAGVAAGAAAGAAIGAIAAHGDAGFDKKYPGRDRWRFARRHVPRLFLVTTSQDFVEAVRESGVSCQDTLTLAQGHCQ